MCPISPESKPSDSTQRILGLPKAQEVKGLQEATYAKIGKMIAPVELIPGTKILFGQEEFDKSVKTFLEKRRKKDEVSSNKYSDIHQGNLFVLEGSHHDVSPKRFLIERMKEFKKNGVGILFMEHFFYDKQHLLDEFNKTGVMPQELKEHVAELDRRMQIPLLFSKDQSSYELSKKYNFTEILIAAREAGIRLVGIDIEDVYNAYKGNDTTGKRIAYMNYTASQIIDLEMAATDTKCNYMCFAGCAHGHENSGVPGLSELNGGTRTLLISDVRQQDPKDQTIKFNGVNTLFGEQIKSGIAIFSHPSKSIDPAHLLESNPEHPQIILDSKVDNDGTAQISQRKVFK